MFKFTSFTMRVTHHILLLFLIGAPCILMSQEMGALKVTLGVKDSKLVVASSEFNANGIVFPSTAKADLVAFLNQSFVELDSLVENRATAWNFPDIAAVALDTVFYQGYSLLTAQDGVGRPVSREFNRQVGEKDLPFSLSDFLGLKIFDPLSKYHWSRSPLSINFDDLEERDIQNLEFEFSVKPPFSLNKYVVKWDGDHVLPKSKTQKILGSLDGQLYFQNKIEELVESYFILTKYQPIYDISDSVASIIPTRLTRIIIKTKNKADVHKVLYQLLPAEYYKIAAKIPVDSLPKFNNVDYIFSLFDQVDGKLSKLPRIQTDVLQISLIQLGKLNYSLGQLSKSDFVDVPNLDKNPYSEMYISQIEVDTSSVTPPKRIPSTNEDGVIAANDLPSDHSSFDNERIDPKAKKPEKPNNTDLGVGFNQSFGDGNDVYLNFQHTAKDASSFSVQTGFTFNENGIKNGGLFISGSYFKDYLFFDALNKKLSLQITGQSTYTTNRVLEGIEAKERRTGGKVRLQLDWFRDADGHQLTTYLSLQSQKLNLRDFQEKSISETTLSFLEIGKIWFLGKASAHRTNYLIVEPEIKLGFAQNSGNGEIVNYLVSNLRLNWQRRWPRGFAFSFGGYWQHGSKLTPLVEQPALNTSTNRGFRQDDIISNKLIGLQPEIWLPLTGSDKNNGGFNDYLFKKVRLALFTDATWYSRGQDKGDDLLLSPGLGLRFIEFPAQVNFDWAWGIAPQNLNAGKSRFSISLTLKSPI